MAGLNTLRNRGGVIITIVIGIALIGFLLGDFLSTGGNNGSNTKVGKINGTDISYSQYQNQVDYMTQIQEIMTGTNNRSTDDYDQIREQAWEQLVTDYAYDPGFNELGLVVGDDEARDMIDGKFISPVIGQIFVNPQTGTFDQAMVKNYIANLDNDQSGNARVFWNFIENQMIQQRLMSKFLTIVEQGVFVTDLEVKQALASGDNLYSANCISQSYATIPDSTVKVDQADVRKFYDKNKDMFKQVASRDIEYVLFEVLPSEADFTDAQKYVAEIATEFAATQNIAQYVGVNSQSPFNPTYFKESELDGEIANFAFGANRDAMYGPVLEGDVYTMARITDVKMLADSMGALHIQMPSTEKTKVDSVFNAVKAGGNFTELAATYSVSQDATKGGDLGRFTYNNLPAEISSEVFKAKNGDIIKVEFQNSTHIFVINHKGAESKKVQLGVISYKVDASSATQQNAYSAASKFIADAQGSLDNFNNSVIANGVNKRVARIRTTDKAIRGLENSRELIRWAFSDNKNPVSAIMEIDNNYVVAAVTAKREDGLADLDQVKSDIMALLVKEKKADMIADKMKGFKSLEDASVSMTAPVSEIKDLDYAMFFIPEVGMEPTLIGAICNNGNTLNKLSNPIKSESGVFLFDVTAKTAREDINAATIKENLNVNASSYIGERTVGALRSMCNIKDSRVKFF